MALAAHKNQSLCQCKRLANANDKRLELFMKCNIPEPEYSPGSLHWEVYKREYFNDQTKITDSGFELLKWWRLEVKSVMFRR